MIVFSRNYNAEAYELGQKDDVVTVIVGLANVAAGSVAVLGCDSIESQEEGTEESS